MRDPEILVENLIEDIRETVGVGKLYVGFSGGEDSSLVAILSKKALGPDRVVLVTIDWGIYTYERSRDIVRNFARKYGLKHIFIDGSGTQRVAWRYGPSCNACTKRVKIPLLKRVANGNLVATGANSYDTWGKTGIKIKDGVYAPLHDLTKDEIRSVLRYLNVDVEKIGESKMREGCKLKNLLKPLINESYHGDAVSRSNEVLLKILRENSTDVEVASVKIIGPLSKNIAVVVTKPPFPEKLKKLVHLELSKIETIDDIVFASKNVEVHVVASSPIYKNESARRNMEKVIGIPGKYVWHESRNKRLRTFQVVEVKT